MLFWIAAALLTFAASLTVLVPLSGRRERSTGGGEIEVYRDQLTEIDRDAARGLLAAEEAEQARAEIGRRIIKIDSRSAAGPGPAGIVGLSRLAAAAAVISVPLVSWGLYTTLGSPDLPSQPLAWRLSKNPADSTPEELVARAEAQLALNPDDLRGWDVLAPIYVQMNRFQDAIMAYRNAIRLGGTSAARQAGLGEAIVFAGGGLVSKEAQTAFEAAQDAEAGYPKSRFFLAMAKVQEGDGDEAVKDWQSMVSTLPESDPWRSAAETMLARAGKADEPGPDQPQIDAAAEMAPAERTAMIEQMVAGLDAKLRQNPQDAEGWKRLVRSYLVLGKRTEANDALARATQALGAESPAAKELAAFAASEGLKVNQ